MEKCMKDVGIMMTQSTNHRPRPMETLAKVEQKRVKRVEKAEKVEGTEKVESTEEAEDIENKLLHHLHFKYLKQIFKIFFRCLQIMQPNVTNYKLCFLICFHKKIK